MIKPWKLCSKWPNALTDFSSLSTCLNMYYHLLATKYRAELFSIVIICCLTVSDFKIVLFYK